jgi:hypothetical protein
VPPILSDVQTAPRVDQAQHLLRPLRLLQAQRARAWQDIATLDESRFDMTTCHEVIWLPQREKIPESERPLIGSEKFMVTIVWNPYGFH